MSRKTLNRLAVPEGQPSVAIFSSFRKFLGQVSGARDLFIANGIYVSNPPNTTVLNPGAEYVRFEGDDPNMSDREIQNLVIKRALASTAIYVVCPRGYTGTLVSYEIGWVQQAGAPLYFSEMPNERFIRHDTADRIVNPRQLSDMISKSEVTPIGKRP